MEELLVLARLRDAIIHAADTHVELNTNWKVVRNSKEDSRYNRPSREKAEELPGALDDRNHGVLRWLMLHW
jgi:hypothetical protein